MVSFSLIELLIDTSDGAHPNIPTIPSDVQSLYPVCGNGGGVRGSEEVEYEDVASAGYWGCRPDQVKYCIDEYAIGAKVRLAGCDDDTKGNYFY